MRELKFRVWNGMEMVHDVTIGKFGAFYVNPGDKGNGLDPKDSASLTPFNTKYHEGTPVMEYTGLKDKNGVEIYEGDIVNFAIKEKRCTNCDNENHLSAVDKFCQGCGQKLEYSDFVTPATIVYNKASWSLSYVDKKYNSGMLWGHYAAEQYIAWIEVTGNIFENPELIPKIERLDN